MERTVFLVLADDPIVRASLADAIAREDREVVRAASPEELFVRLQSRPMDVLVVGDQSSRRDLVRDLLPLVAARAASVATVVLRPTAGVDDGVEAMKLGAVDFLLHPCPTEVLETALARAACIARTRRSIAAVQRRREPLVGNSRAMQNVREMIACLSGGDGTTVLIEGETGTGKEVVAQAIQEASARRGAPYIRLNCAALPEAIFEAELFGHEKGAFTSALAQRPGMVEAASGGTILLDEIGDLPQTAQAKLLRFLEDKSFRRVGGVEERTADVRIIAATHVGLAARVAARRFRSDLFFRLNVIRVHLPPLRERREDVVTLTAAFLVDFNERFGRSVRGISAEALDLLERYAWPGNVRELRNVVERAFILSPRMEELRPEHLPRHIASCSSAPPIEQAPRDLALHAAEQRLLSEAMLRAGGNQSRAATMLGITRFTLRYRLRKYGMLPARSFADPTLAAAAGA